MKNRPLLKSIIGKQILYFDGGTGSVLQARGLLPGEFPERWNITHSQEIIDLHYSYFRSGANIVKLNTFGAFSSKFPFKHNKDQSVTQRVLSSPECLEDVIKAAVANANVARDKIETEELTEQEIQSLRSKNLLPQGTLPSQRPHYIALDIGSCGKLLKPMGDLDFEDAISLFKETIRIGVSCGVDAILIETMNDCYEAKAAVIAAKETLEEYNQDLPIFVTTVYDESGRLLTGADPETMTAILEGLGVTAFGMNCSLGPKQMVPIVPRMVKEASIPVIVNPNAGLPRTQNGTTVYDVDANEFAQVMKAIADCGANILGGCCGTTPEYICCTVNATQNKKPFDITKKTETVIASYTHTVKIGGANPPVIIGERINPTGKKKFREALCNEDFPYIVSQGLEREKAGAHVLDVNVGLPEIDEKQMMLKVLSELQAVTALPLQIDTSTPSVMEAALRRYNGKALVNSVNGKKEIMQAVFPLVKKYGGVVVALTIDENGIPETAEGRLEIARKLYQTASLYGIDKKDIIIDPLAMAVSSDDKAPLATLQTVGALYKEGCRTILGISNISFGLPQRELVTSAFYTMALQNGLSCAIMNPNSKEMMKAYYCFCLLSNHDAQCLNYISFATEYAKQKETSLQSNSTLASDALKQIAQIANQALGNKTITSTESSSSNNANSTNKSSDVSKDSSPLKDAIVHGLKSDATTLTKELLKTQEAISIINEHLIPALDIVGKGFEEKKVYLPQLLMSAEAAAVSFAEIKTHLKNTGKAGKSRGTIIVATVKGDIHDIGKNIVKVLLENYDFTVIDLGKDVPPETIVDRCIKDHVHLVGLSALMTTTVPSMEATIKLLNEKAPWAKVCVGGAVMTKEYADMIHADFYGKDAMATVKYAENFFESLNASSSM